MEEKGITEPHALVKIRTQGYPELNAKTAKIYSTNLLIYLTSQPCYPSNLHSKGASKLT